MMGSKLFLKQAGISFLSKLGVLRFLHYKNRHKICVLMLHGVMEVHEKSKWEPLRSQLPPSELKRILNILSDFYQFIDVTQAIGILDGSLPIIDNGLLVTFDDGYRNNIDYALPICEQFGIKPILFVTTRHIDSDSPFWFDRLDYALQQNMGEIIKYEYEGHHYQFDATSRQSLKDSFKKFRDYCKEHFSDDIKLNQLFTGLSEMLEHRSKKSLRHICKTDDWSAIATWDDLNRCVKADKLDIGSHTVDHFRLNCLDKNKIKSQLVKSKSEIELELKIKCQYFCYPNGDYDAQSILLVKESGFQAAFSTDVGLCNPKGDLMKLKRFNFPSYKTKSELLYLLNSSF